LTLRVPEFLTRSGYTCYGEGPRDSLDYISIFRIGEEVRANAFLYVDVTPELVQSLKADPLSALARQIPSLSHVLSQCELVGRPDMRFVDLYRCKNVIREGLFLIGDAYRTSCPSVGSGLTCALIDIDVLAKQIPAWLQVDRPGQLSHVRGFYDHPDKVSQDNETQYLARRRRQAVRADTPLLYIERIMRFAARMIRDRVRGNYSEMRRKSRPHASTRP
jgi:2-polyprenyl-6-methoxyphenol hydroxylase-like FAD-dependent oxidoreductase